MTKKTKTTKTIEYVEIKSNEKIQHNIYKMKLISEEVSRIAQPGQFIMIYLDNGINLLPRPISICDIEDEEITIIYHTIGNGTRQLSMMPEGEELRILGPLGNGFNVIEQTKNALLVGGGIGTPPMYYLAKELQKIGVEEITVALGFRKRTLLVDEFKAIKNTKVHIATDLGTAGYHGNIVEFLREKNANYLKAYACGPLPMLSSLSAFAKEIDMPLEVSLEEHMACGVGTCFACVTKKHDGTLEKICTAGPVFNHKEVAL